MNLFKSISNLFTKKDPILKPKEISITIDTYSPIADLISKKELKYINKLIISGPARGGKDSELFNFIKLLCNKYQTLESIDLRGIVGMEEVKQNALTNCISLKEILLPDGIKEIETEAFCGCEKLQSIDLPEGLERIKEKAFANCLNLSSVKLPKSLYRIGKEVFLNDSSLTQITIPSKVESIGVSAFNCQNLSSLTIEPHNPSYKCIDNVLYSKNGSALVKYVNGKTESTFEIPQEVAKIGESAFENAKSLTTIVIPNNVTIIAKSAFKNCENISSITIPKSVEKIDDECFSNCKNLKSIELSEGISIIGRKAFENCILLKQITIPNSVHRIDDEAFINCENLLLSIPTTVESIGKDVTKGTIIEK